MGLRIIEGCKINDGPYAGKAAVIYESVSMLAYPFIFENGADASAFLEAHADFGSLSEAQQGAQHRAWVEGGRSKWQKSRALTERLVDEVFDAVP